MAAGHDRPFTRAFAAWFATAADLHDIMVIGPCADRDAVDIKFRIGGDALRGYAHPAGFNVSAMLRGECWDFLFDEDLIVGQTPYGWHCTLCVIENQRNFGSIEALWVDHLFEPFGIWTIKSLLDASILSFFEYNASTWVELHKSKIPLSDCLVTSIKL